MKISVTVNGTAYDRDVEPRTLLAYFLRENLGLTGTHVGCDTSSCGCCVVLMDGGTQGLSFLSHVCGFQQWRAFRPTVTFLPIRHRHLLSSQQSNHPASRQPGNTALGEIILVLARHGDALCESFVVVRGEVVKLGAVGRGWTHRRCMPSRLTKKLESMV